MKSVWVFLCLCLVGFNLLSEETYARSLSSGDRLFLEKHYDVYDPDTRSYHKDFSRIKEVDVVFIGEFHQTHVLHRTQYKTLDRLRPPCVLLEGSFPGQNLNQDPAWRGLSKDITFLGSDIRCKTPIKNVEQLSAHMYYEKAKRLAYDKFTQHEKLAQQQASLLNQALKDKEAVIIDDQRTVVVSPALLEQLKPLTPQKHLELEALLEETRQKKEEMNTFTELDGGELKQSNRGLVHEIQKALKQFPSIVSIWGLDHFWLGDEMFSKLRKAHISYIVLVPSQRSWEKAMKELEWKYHIVETVSLTLNQDIELQVPKAFQHFFHPSLPFIQPKIEEPEVIDTENLLEIFKGQKEPISWTWPAHIPFHLKEMSTDCLIEFGDNFGEGSQFRKTPATLDPLFQCLNEMLMLGNRRILGVHLAGHLQIDVSQPSRSERRYVEVGLTEPIVFEIGSQDSVGTAAYLFQEMQRLSKSFKMKPGSRVQFLDITPKKLHAILEDATGAQFKKWLKSRAPKNMEVIIKGQLTLGKLPYSDTSGSKEVLEISTEQGCKISLRPCKKH